MQLNSRVAVGVATLFLLASNAGFSEDISSAVSSNIEAESHVSFLTGYGPRSGSRPRDRDMIKPPIVPRIPPK